MNLKQLISFVRRKEVLILILLLFIGIFLRTQALLTNSFAFTYDTGRDLLAVQDIVQNLNVSLIGPTSGLPGVFYGPWWYFMLVPFYILFNGNPWGIALEMVIMGMLVIPLSYYLGLKLAGRFLGIIFASLVTVSPILISFSSQIWNPNPAPLFVILIFITLYKIFENDKKKIFYFFAAGFLSALSVDLEIVFGVLLSMAVVITLIVFERRRLISKNGFLFILGFLIILSPRIVFELRNGFLMTKSLINFLTSGDTPSFSYLNIFFERLAFLFREFNSTIAVDRFFGYVLLMFMVVSLFLGYKKLHSSAGKILALNLITIVVFAVGLTFFTQDVWQHFAVGLPVVFIFLLSVSIFLFSNIVNSRYLALGVLFIVFIINLNPIAIAKSYGEPLWAGDASVYRNQLAVIDYVYKEAEGKPFRYVVYTPAVHDYPYKYLFNWYGERRYGYTPSNTPELGFFILEPDIQVPTRLTDWINQRRDDGEIVKTETLPSGIIIQTRVN